MLTPRRVFAVFVLVVVFFVARGHLPKQQFHFPQNINSTALHIPNLGRPTFRQALTPNISGPAVDLYTPRGMQTYPRAIKLRSGNLLAGITTFEPENTIALSLSQDQGLSWKPYSIVATATTSNIQLNNAFLLELPSTRLLCAFRSHTLKPEAVGAEEKPGGQNEGYLYYKLMIYFSDDIGKTWSYLSTPVQGPGPRHGLWEPFLRLTNKGDLQFYYSQEEGPRDQDNLMRTSNDGGKTWTGHTFVSGENLPARDGMIGIQELEKGSGVLMAVFESVEEHGEEGHFEARFQVWCATSRDDGKSWGERRMIYEGFWNEPIEHAMSEYYPLCQIWLKLILEQKEMLEHHKSLLSVELWWSAS